jgi:hypothetical protein
MRFLVLAFTLFTVLTISATQTKRPFGDLQEEQIFKDYTVRIYRNGPEIPFNGSDIACFEILRAGKQVYFQTGNKFEIGNSGNSDITNKLIAIGQSITSDKQPNLVIKEWSGGAHCCYTFFIFQISDTFKFIDRIELRNGIGADFKDLRHEGSLEVVMSDWTFEYWNACFAESYAPNVILRFESGKYRPDLALMKKPAPSLPKLETLAAEIRPLFASKEVKDEANNDLQVPPRLWGEMLDLIYSGNMKAAWELCDLSWPTDNLGKTRFLKEFRKQLATSPYYAAISQSSFQN